MDNKEDVLQAFSRRFNATQVRQGEVPTVPGSLAGSNMKAHRPKVDYRYDALNWDFIHCLAEIAFYAAEKHGRAENWTESDLIEDRSPLNHMYDHLRQYQTRVLHDHFSTLEHQLAAVAYNAMMEFYYFRCRGKAVSEVMDYHLGRMRMGNQAQEKLAPKSQSAAASLAPEWGTQAGLLGQPFDKLCAFCKRGYVTKVNGKMVCSNCTVEENDGPNPTTR